MDACRSTYVLLQQFICNSYCVYYEHTNEDFSRTSRDVVMDMEESHRRALRSGLKIIEKHLRRIKSDLEGDGKRSTPFEAGVIDIDAKVGTGISNITISMLDEISRLKEKFEIKPEEEFISWKRQLYGILIEIEVILDDLRPETLESYGQMTEADKEQLRPHIMKLRNMVNDIYGALR